MEFYFEAAIRVIGWIGAALVLLAFFLVGRKHMLPESRASAMMNLVGALLLGANTIYFSAYASAALNIIWAVIAGWNLRSSLIKSRTVPR